MFERVIYVPTLRCNCKCKHCGQDQFMDSECEPAFIVEKLLQSSHGIKSLSITGGEPFLKTGFAQAIGKYINYWGGVVDFTTNGICLGQIKELVDTSDRKEQMLFSVSIDGLSEIHNQIRRNPIAFERAMETVKYLKEQGVPVKINTVVQRGNYTCLERFKKYVVLALQEQVEFSWIPLISEINGEDVFPYTQSEVDEIRPLFPAPVDLAYLDTQGEIKIQVCHAGRKTIVIAPNGEVYSCLTGFSYKGIDQRKKYLIGDLRGQSLDEIYLEMQKEDAPYRRGVGSCSGCWNPCEVSNEIAFWGMDLEGCKKDALQRIAERPSTFADLRKQLNNINHEMEHTAAALDRAVEQCRLFANPGDHLSPDTSWNMLVYLFKKCVRKACRFYLLEQQQYNRSMLECVKLLKRSTGYLQSVTHELEHILADDSVRKQ